MGAFGMVTTVKQVGTSRKQTKNTGFPNFGVTEKEMRKDCFN